MAIPDFQSVMRPVLATVQNGAPLPLNELRERVADQFQLTEDERKERLPSGHQTVINNRVGWARTYLNKAGLLTIPLSIMIIAMTMQALGLSVRPDIATTGAATQALHFTWAMLLRNLMPRLNKRWDIICGSLFRLAEQ